MPKNNSALSAVRPSLKPRSTRSAKTNKKTERQLTRLHRLEAGAQAVSPVPPPAEEPCAHNFKTLTEVEQSAIGTLVITRVQCSKCSYIQQQKVNTLNRDNENPEPDATSSSSTQEPAVPSPPARPTSEPEASPQAQNPLPPLDPQEPVVKQPNGRVTRFNNFGVGLTTNPEGLLILDERTKAANDWASMYLPPQPTYASIFPFQLKESETLHT